MGGSSMFAPPDLFVNTDVVLVTINYRLGPFGKRLSQHVGTSTTNGTRRISLNPG
jgi:carboxylesterase type B